MGLICPCYQVSHNLDTESPPNTKIQSSSGSDSPCRFHASGLGALVVKRLSNTLTGDPSAMLSEKPRNEDSPARLPGKRREAARGGAGSPCGSAPPTGTRRMLRLPVMLESRKMDLNVIHIRPQSTPKLSFLSCPDIQYCYCRSQSSSTKCSGKR